MISTKMQRSLSNASTRIFRAVSDIILSTDAASNVDVLYHHYDNDFCLKNLSSAPVANAHYNGRHKPRRCTVRDSNYVLLYCVHEVSPGFYKAILS